MDILQVKQLRDNAYAPVKKHKLDAGWDLFAPEDFTIGAYPNNTCDVELGIAITVPSGTYGRIAPRSGLARDGIDILGGVVDEGYTGELIIMMINHKNKKDFKKGDRIAQLVIEKIAHCRLVIVSNLNKLDDRGNGGLGSTGV